MTVATSKQDLVANYRYIVADLVSGTILNEISFENVTYGRALREAGSFSGDIPVIDDTFNLALYKNTIPGKTALYIVRNGVCVWGGIIWSRTYNIMDKMLQVSGSEFTSYLYHRAAWRTWKNEFEASVSVTSGTGTATLTYDIFNFKAGSPVYLAFKTDVNMQYNGYYVINSSPAPTTNTFSFSAMTAQGTPIGTFTEDVTTVSVRQDSYEYFRDMLEALKVDFYSMDFPNTEIEPSADFAYTATAISRNNNEAVVTLNADHDMIVGQRVSLKGIGSGFETNLLGKTNGHQLVTRVPASNQVAFTNNGSNVSLALNPIVRNVSFVARDMFGVVTVTTSVAHGFAVGDLVYISGVSPTTDGTWTVTSVSVDGLSFNYLSIYTTVINKSSILSGTATKKPEVRFSTYGEYVNNSGLDISYSTSGLSGQAPRVNPVYRGSELRMMGELLDDYSNIPNGFEYRIDCSFNATTQKFDKVFKFLPIKPQSLVDYLATLPGGKLPTGTYAPVSAFYNASNLVFEHPGNILNASFEETAENAATRFWVQGTDDTGNADASLPYAADSSMLYLDAAANSDGRPWPILDQVEKINDVSDETTLFKYATRYLNESLPPMANLSVTVNGSARPILGTYAPGDWCSVNIKDDVFVSLRLASSLEPSQRGVLLRKIQSFEVSVPNNPSFPEEVTLQLVTEPEVDKVGA